MPIPHHRTRPPYIGYWLLLAITKTPLLRVFSGNLPETTANKYPLSPENRNMHAAPSCIMGIFKTAWSRLEQY